MFATVAFAQGIAVQGIARDNTNSAISNTELTFYFFIVNSDSDILYKETQNIRTDTYGLFSHVVSNGRAQDNTVFTNIDFSQADLKLQVRVNFDSQEIVVYDQKLQYVPYAHFAKKAQNGVPPGTVVAFMGNDDAIPAGWVKCDGTDISNEGVLYDALKLVIGNTLPDLRGRFLKGEGVGANIPEEKIEVGTIGDYQGQGIASHLHELDLETDEAGEHNHKISIYALGYRLGTSNDIYLNYYPDSNSPNGGGYTTSTDGNHKHTIKGNTKGVGGKENRPWTAVVNYIIKL